MHAGRLDTLLSALRRPVLAGVVLLLGYASLSLLLDPSGYLGTDTGTKTYTLHLMSERDDFDPDLGYWAQAEDPDGSVHPVHQVQRRPDGAWVGVTTLPVLFAARPLWDLGGYRAALLLPMLGGVAAAVAARSVGRMMGATSERSWVCFWVVGLASPVAVYALDFWEHSIGVACIVSAVAVLLGVLCDRPAWWASGAGFALGVGAVLRQEVLVYGFVATAAACLLLLVSERAPGRAVLCGASVVAGFAIPWWANGVLERAVAGQSRAARSAGAVQAAGGAEESDLHERIREGAQTLLGLVAGAPAVSVLLGLAVVGAVVVAARGERRGDRSLALVAIVAASLVYVADAVGGLGFVPGLLPAFPLAIGGLLVRHVDRAAKVVIGVAVCSLPLVYAFQYLGGAQAQWGGRYTLASGTLLGVVALVHLPDQRPMVARGLVGLSVLVTATGVAWLAQRTHASDHFFDQVVEEAEGVVIARQAFLLREGGPVLDGRTWLSAESEAEFAEALDVADAVGASHVTVLEWNGPGPPSGVIPDGLVEVRRVPLRFVNTPVGLVVLERTG